MDAFDVFMNRRSVRRYHPGVIPRQLLEQALEAARFAPTARNQQPWEFVVVTDPARLKQLSHLAETGRFIAQASACIGVICQETKYYLEDGVSAVVVLLYALQALGLGTCWVAGDKKAYAETVLQFLGVPAGRKLVALVPVGYAADSSPRPPKRTLASQVHWEQFGAH